MALLLRRRQYSLGRGLYIDALVVLYRLGVFVVVIFFRVFAAARVALAGPQRGQDNLLEAGLDGALIEPGVDAGLDELGNLGDVLEAGAGADEGADREVEAVVVEEGEG